MANSESELVTIPGHRRKRSGQRPAAAGHRISSKLTPLGGAMEVFKMFGGLSGGVTHEDFGRVKLILEALNSPESTRSALANLEAAAKNARDLQAAALAAKSQQELDGAAALEMVRIKLLECDQEISRRWKAHTDMIDAAHIPQREAALLAKGAELDKREAALIAAERKVAQQGERLAAAARAVAAA